MKTLNTPKREQHRGGGFGGSSGGGTATADGNLTLMERQKALNGELEKLRAACVHANNWESEIQPLFDRFHDQFRDFGNEIERIG